MSIFVNGDLLHRAALVLAEEEVGRLRKAVRRVADVEMRLPGGVGTQLQIEKGKRNLCHYETGFGSMTLGVTADEIVNELTEKGGTVRFAYLLDANSADLVSRNRLEVTVTHVN